MWPQFEVALFSYEPVTPYLDLIRPSDLVIQHGIYQRFTTTGPWHEFIPGREGFSWN